MSGEDWELFLQKDKKRIQSWGVRWLNVAGIVILIKSMLLSLSVYLGSRLLAPKNIIHSISSLIKNLVNWNTTRFLNNLGGLAIKDPEYMNLDFGSKLVYVFYVLCSCIVYFLCLRIRMQVVRIFRHIGYS